MSRIAKIAIIGNREQFWISYRMLAKFGISGNVAIIESDEYKALDELGFKLWQFWQLWQSYV